ncbi:hypothetical protein [Bradyrhizobium sp. SBR1B]|uniref:hypothetical protein n=1 Tax=Bradyrhizobium sp. SBR1B TaxID=2663836 RepID=UPI001605F13A|nr:hypothetical protein [Bradyrhizobium sp. SBR1B]MBB4377773.1 hypothetical protein [Bradyrhizobium sp. SBR1B]
MRPDDIEPIGIAVDRLNLGIDEGGSTIPATEVSANIAPIRPTSLIALSLLTQGLAALDAMPAMSADVAGSQKKNCRSHPAGEQRRALKTITLRLVMTPQTQQIACRSDFAGSSGTS